MELGFKSHMYPLFSCFHNVLDRLPVALILANCFLVQWLRTALLHREGHRFNSYRSNIRVVSSMVEQVAVNHEAIGSSPILPAIKLEEL